MCCQRTWESWLNQFSPLRQVWTIRWVEQMGFLGQGPSWPGWPGQSLWPPARGWGMTPRRRIHLDPSQSELSWLLRVASKGLLNCAYDHVLSRDSDFSGFPLPATAGSGGLGTLQVNIDHGLWREMAEPGTSRQCMCLSTLNLLHCFGFLCVCWGGGVLERERESEFLTAAQTSISKIHFSTRKVKVELSCPL